MFAIGEWGQKWVTTESSLGKLDPNLLMWDMRRNISTKPLPQRRSTIQVIFSDLQEPRRNWWLIVEPGAEVDLCSVDPGFDVLWPRNSGSAAVASLPRRSRIGPKKPVCGKVVSRLEAFQSLQCLDAEIIGLGPSVSAGVAHRGRETEEVKVFTGRSAYS